MVMDSNKTIRAFPLPDCSADKVYTLYGNLKLLGDFLLLQKMDPESRESFVQIVYLPELFDNATNSTCLPTTDTYFQEDKVYIYQIEGNILRRREITADGLTDPQFVVETENVCFFLSLRYSL